MATQNSTAGTPVQIDDANLEAAAALFWEQHSITDATSFTTFLSGLTPAQFQTFLVGLLVRWLRRAT